MVVRINHIQLAGVTHHVLHMTTTVQRHCIVTDTKCDIKDLFTVYCVLRLL